MAALVVEHEAAEVTKVAALEVPAVHGQREAMDEDEGQRLLAVPVDLDVQPDAVVAADGPTGRVQSAEVLAGIRVGSAARALSDSALCRVCSGGGARRRGDDRRGEADPAALHACIPEYTRGTRDPILVTIS